MCAHYTDVQWDCPYVAAVGGSLVFQPANPIKCAPFVPSIYMEGMSRTLLSSERAMANSTVYKVIFYNQNQVFEIYARAIYQSEMYGFIEVEEFVFGERSQLLVDPAEEKLKSEFASVKRSYLPMHSIIRIDEVEKEGAVRISEVKSSDKVMPFPFPPAVPRHEGD